MGDAKPDITARALEMLAKVPKDDVTWDSEAANEGLETPSSDYIDGVNDSIDTYARPMADVLRELVAEVERLRGSEFAVSDRDREIIHVLIDDVEAFGAGDDTDRCDEKFQSDTRALLRRLLAMPLTRRTR